MATILTTLQDGVDQRLAEHVNIPGRALNGLLITDDNAGKLIVPVGLGFPFTLRSGVVPETRPIGPGTFTVGAGKFLYVVTLTGPGSAVNYTLDPADAASWTVAMTTNIGRIPVGLCLGAGDAITVPAGAAAVGIQVDASALVGSPTRVLKELSNTVSHSVGASKVLLGTCLIANTSTTTNLTIDSSAAGTLQQQPSAVAAGGRETLWLKTGQQVAASNAAPFTLSGLEYAV